MTDAPDSTQRDQRGNLVQSTTACRAGQPTEPQPTRWLGVRSPVGAGKTEQAIRTIRSVLAADAGARVAFAVPDHRLAAEATNRLRDALGNAYPVAVWRGLDREDPAAPGETMCRRAVEAARVAKAGGEVSDLCGSRRASVGFCPFNPDNPACPAGQGCGYRRQGADARTARVVVVPHAMLARPAPGPMQRPGRSPFDLVVIDEQFFSQMLRGFDAQPEAVPLDDLHARHWGSMPRQGTEPPEWAARKVQNTLRRLLDAASSAGQGGCVDALALGAAGLTSGDAREARVMAFRMKIDVRQALMFAGATGRADPVPQPVAENNARTLRVAQALDVVARVLDNDLGPAAIRVGTHGGQTVLLLRWREDIHADWRDPSLGGIHLDATMSPDIVRRWLPGLVVPPVAHAAAPHMMVSQVTDRAMGYSALVPSKARGAEGERTARNNVGRVRRILERMSAACAGRGALGGPDVALIGPKALLDDLRPQLPPNVGAVHFNALRGQDQFGGVAAALIVSRVMPPPRAVEDMAEVIFGRAVSRLREFYPKRPASIRRADGTGYRVSTHYHPDPHAEAIRQVLAEGELAQAVGRVRGTRRTAANPVDVRLLTNMPVEGLVVNETLSVREAWSKWGGLDPVLALLEAGVVPADWHGRGAVLSSSGFFTGAKRPADAAKLWFRRNQHAEARLAAGLGHLPRVPPANVDQSCMGNTSTGVIHIPRTGSAWTGWRYRLAGHRKGSLVLVADFHSDPKAAVAQLIGPLAEFSATSRGTTPSAERKPITTPCPSEPPAASVEPAAPGPVCLPAAAPTPARAVGDAPAVTATDATAANVPDRPVRLPVVIKMAGRDMAAFRAFLQRPTVRRMDAMLAAQGVRRELRAAAAARIWIGPEQFAKAMAAAALAG
jgi:hypothetical protein